MQIQCFLDAAWQEDVTDAVKASVQQPEAVFAFV